MPLSHKIKTNPDAIIIIISAAAANVLLRNINNAAPRIILNKR
jgi:hypothetical protein